MTVYFVDGPDGVGKTGYSQYLSEETGIPRLEMRPASNTDNIEVKSEVFNAAIRDLYDQDVELVIDRGSTSSIVYSRVFGRENPKHAWKTIRHVEPVIVYLRCDPDELAVRYGNNDEIFNADEIREIAEVYDEVMSDVQENTDATVAEIDTTVPVTDRLQDVVFADRVDERRDADNV